MKYLILIFFLSHPVQAYTKAELFYLPAPPILCDGDPYERDQPAFDHYLRFLSHWSWDHTGSRSMFLRELNHSEESLTVDIECYFKESEFYLGWELGFGSHQRTAAFFIYALSEAFHFQRQRIRNGRMINRENGWAESYCNVTFWSYRTDLRVEGN